MSQEKQRRPGDGGKIAGAGWHILGRESHHWWPQGLSNFWADQDGLTFRLTSSGEVKQSPPKNFGVISSAHAIKLDGPWNATIEPIFDFADDNLPRIVTSILEMIRAEKTVDDRANRHFQNRVRAYAMGRQERDAFAECLASLILRSPEFRNRIRLTINAYREDFGHSEISARDNLIAGNIYQWFPNAVADFRQAHIALLYSHDSEFIFGEGYLNNVSGPTHTSNLRAVLPLTPELTAICFSGSGNRPPSQICSLAVTALEVSGINCLTQIYTKDYIYFRSQKPSILDIFARNQFLQRSHHEDALIESIILDIRNTRLAAK